MRDHTKLRVSELADEVEVLIYPATRGFPKVLGALIRPMRNHEQPAA